MVDTNEFWAGSFGDAYTKRNRVDWQSRIPFWKEMMEQTGARSVHEIGCNAGWNLSAIQRAFPDILISGSDINEDALKLATSVGLAVHAQKDVMTWFSMPVELVFTAGVMIHVAPDELDQFIEDMIAMSSRFVLAIEYDALIETEVLYRGHTGKLWKRPYGRRLENHGLTLISKQDPGPGFDNCHAWLMEKP